MTSTQRWLPGVLLAVGCLLNGPLVTRRVASMPLRAPIKEIAVTALGITGTDLHMTDDERKVAGMTDYVGRDFMGDGVPEFTIYVGYYDEQHQGKSIHSPKNCLPGAGWEPLDSRPLQLAAATGPVTVNRYRLVRSDQPSQSALVYYWYQGRGRIAHDEMRVKYELLRDAALRGRTEEALVRIVVFFSSAGSGEAAADSVARKVALPLIGEVDKVLPTY